MTLSALFKPAFAILIFCTIVGGWLSYGRYREAHAPLPDSAERQGACALWFIGSSSVRRWSTVGRDMQPWIAHNRGIDDASYPEIRARFANEHAQAPGAIILYAGENDLANGTPVRTVLRQLAMFVEERRAAEGNTPILLLSMKPSPKRAYILRDQLLFNAAARHLAMRDPSIHYLDVTTPLMETAKAKNLYQPDQVHMNARGYAIWADVVTKALASVMPVDIQRRCSQPHSG